jgi:hypothetical protein
VTRSRLKLEIALWVLGFLSLGSLALAWDSHPGFSLFFFLLTGIPAAMLTLHLHPPKFFKYLERHR